MSEDLVGLVLHLGFGREPPATGPSTTRFALETSIERTPESRLRAAVLERRCGFLDDRAMNHLGTNMTRQRRQIGERGELRARGDHATSIPCESGCDTSFPATPHFLTRRHAA